MANSNTNEDYFNVRMDTMPQSNTHNYGRLFEGSSTSAPLVPAYMSPHDQPQPVPPTIGTAVFMMSGLITANITAIPSSVGATTGGGIAVFTGGTAQNKIHVYDLVNNVPVYKRPLALPTVCLTMGNEQLQLQEFSRSSRTQSVPQMSGYQGQFLVHLFKEPSLTCLTSTCLQFSEQTASQVIASTMPT